uniref:Uncharacterized protein n=1 Tax=Tanacetum cinerariifolium TaxID=118510 RepID=A0A6L2KYR0_TANCI|nr:hypothetical protein [Tanacetum cinerariifolium]
MTMHEVVYKLAVGECHEPNSKGSGSAWKAYINARVPSLSLLEYPNGKGVVRATSRGLDMALHWSGVWAALLMSPREDETSEPILYVRWMAGPYRRKDVTQGFRSLVRMTMHEVVYELAMGECHEPNSKGSSFAWKVYINTRVPGLSLLEYPNGKGVVRATSRGLDMALHWSGVWAALLMSPREDETSEPLLYAKWMAGPYRRKDVTQGRNNDPVTSGIRAKSDQGGRKQNRSRSGSAWKAYINARVSGLSLLVLLEYPNGKGVVRATIRRLDMALYWLGVRAAPLMSPRQEETSEPLLYTGWVTGPYRCKDAMRGRNNDPVTLSPNTNTSYNMG